MTLGRSLVVCLIGWWSAVPSMANDVRFHDLDFEQAAQRASTEEKVVFIDFFTSWCLPCKVMDATTFKNPDVAAWLAEHTVALKVDAEANEENAALAERFRVESYPNYVYVTPDGQILGRITGQRDADEFVADGESAIAGESAVLRAKRALDEGEENDPSLRMGLARAYAELGRNEDALREYLWCFDVGNDHEPRLSRCAAVVPLERYCRLGAVASTGTPSHGDPPGCCRAAHTRRFGPRGRCQGVRGDQPCAR